MIAIERRIIAGIANPQDVAAAEDGRRKQAAG
jgi:hypothetical protein